MILTTILILFTFNSLSQASENCQNLATLIYEDLTCSPRLGSDGCPSSYDCSNVKPKHNSCLFKGVYYKGGEFINGTAGCNLGCFCSAQNPEKPRIVCAVVDCYFGPEQQPECYNIYNRDSCCSAGKQCPPFDDLATCENGGKTYREGERFFPADSCVSCICKKGYKGVYEEPYCAPRKCDVQIKNSDKINANCAPAYRKDDIKCCPQRFICPENSVVENVERAEKDSEEKCRFGKQKFNVKDKLTLKYDESQQASCACNIPPLLTCELSY